MTPDDRLKNSVDVGPDGAAKRIGNDVKLFVVAIDKLQKIDIAF